MKNLLARLTTNRFNAAFAGAFVTSVIQSSSVTTVLVVGFISAGLMTMTQSIGVIMGANIGTTITAQIVAFKVTRYALIMVAIGFAMLFFLKKEKMQQYGHMIMGLGLIFFGMELMSNATRPLRSYEPFIDLMQHMDNPLLGILVSAAFTGLIQSSSATTGVIIVLAGQGFITLKAGIALAFGANIGTCVTAMLASIGKPREAIQAAVVHVIFNVIGVVLWIGFIDQLVAFVTWFSPSTTGLTGADRLAAESPRQIANAHTVFNVANTLLFIWFTGPMGNMVQRLARQKKGATEADEMQPRHLDDILLRTPALAMDIVRMELGGLGAGAYLMVRSSLKPVIEGTAQELSDLEAMDQDVDRLHGSIITYLGRLSQENLTGTQSVRLYGYMAAANYLENIGDLIETNLVEAGRERLASDFQISESTQQQLIALHEKVCYSVEHTVQALANFDREMASEVTQMKEEVNRLASEAEQHLSQRLTAEEPDRLTAFRLETELIEYLKRVYYFAKRIAKVITEEDIVYITSHRDEEEMVKG